MCIMQNTYCFFYKPSAIMYGLKLFQNLSYAQCSTCASFKNNLFQNYTSIKETKENPIDNGGKKNPKTLSPSRDKLNGGGIIA